MYTIGSDPEIMLRDKDNNLVAAGEYFQGTKDDPVVLSNGAGLQVDNVNLEFNIPPATKAAEWKKAHTETLGILQEMAGKHDLHLDICASAVFEERRMTHKTAWIFGCEPDFNVWTLQPNNPPQHPNKLFRSAGGHIHIGITGGMSAAQSVYAGMLCDIYIGELLADYESAEDKERRILYGKYGSIRFKPYGIEYRTPSNLWLRDIYLMEGVYHTATRVADIVKKNNDMQDSTIYALAERGKIIVDKLDTNPSTGLFRELSNAIC